MWKLISTKREHVEKFLFADEECVVGRKDATLLIANDPSISRKHAILFVKHPEENLGYPSRKSSLFMRDEGSKYGTFKNNVRISTEEQLSDGDIVKFGQFESEFRIHYESLVVTTSCLEVVSKNRLKKIIQKLGGHIVSEWQPSCTHLVMNVVKITIKALCCLVSLKPIVLPDYFEELKKKLKTEGAIIVPNDFLPPIGESLMDRDAVSMNVNPVRKNLFKDKTFFFLDNKQFKKLHLGIVMGGGSVSVLSEEKFDPQLLFHDNNCFIEPVKSQLSEKSKSILKDIISALQKKNLRMIPESDIGLAVAYASTEKFCNPKFDIGSAVLGSQRIPSQSLTEREVYAPDTEESAKRPRPSFSNFLNTISSEPTNKKQKVEAADSLNLTSFKDDPENVFEIPLSAQVKEELNTIFDLPMEEENENVQKEQEVTALPAETEPGIHASIIQSDEEKAPEKTVLPKKQKMKIEKNTTLMNGNDHPSNGQISNGHASFMNGDNEETLPRNLATVTFVSLVVRKKPAFTESQRANLNVKNFKKFRKIMPRNSQTLPRIIGVHELIPYNKEAEVQAKKSANNVGEEYEEVDAAPVKGNFDWGSQ